MDGIYLHIPFCVRKCGYCDFVSFPENGMAQGYFDALYREMELWGERCAGRVFGTVFFGGGTPSAVPCRYILRAMEKLRQCFDLRLEEATIECNPGTADINKLAAYRRAGFSRLSLGVQSFDSELLRSIGRIHTAGQAEECVAWAGEAGFENINLDLMYGLPNQTCERYISSIDRAAGLGAAHISAYSLILEEGTPLFGSVKRGETALPDDDDVYRMHREGMARLRELGYRRYEISNYARPGMECRHNLNYWDVGEYLGLGLNSSSALRADGVLRRWKNSSDIFEYESAVNDGRLPVSEAQVIGREEEMFEWAMLGLRKITGVDRREFLRRFGVDFIDAYAGAAEKLRGMGWLETDENSVFLTDRGLDMQNSALMEFMG